MAEGRLGGKSRVRQEPLERAGSVVRRCLKHLWGGKVERGGGEMASLGEFGDIWKWGSNIALQKREWVGQRSSCIWLPLQRHWGRKRQDFWGERTLWRRSFISFPALIFWHHDCIMTDWRLQAIVCTSNWVKHQSLELRYYSAPACQRVQGFPKGMRIKVYLWPFQSLPSPLRMPASGSMSSNCVGVVIMDTQTPYKVS